VKSARVLIVDDEPGIRESLSGVLEDEGFRCHAVAKGEECLEELARSSYELVLLDVWLPGMDGWRRWRESRRFLLPTARR
jgi:two-component system nitrogen regulation response regulator NtrX